MIVLDTDILTIIQRAASPDYERLTRRIDAEVGRSVFVTIISVEEQMRGWLAYIARFRTFEEQVTGYSKLLELVADFQDRPILGFDERTAIESRRLAREKVRERLNGPEDCGHLPRSPRHLDLAESGRLPQGSQPFR